MGLRSKFMAFSIMALGLFAIIQLIYNIRIRTTTDNLVDAYATGTAAIAESSIENIMNNARQAAERLSYGSLIQDYLVPQNDYHLYVVNSYHSDRVQTAIDTNPNISDVAFYRVDGRVRYHYRHEDVAAREVLDQYVDSFARAEPSPGFVCLRSADDEVRFPAYIAPVRNARLPRWSEHIGTIVVMLDAEMLHRIIREVPSAYDSVFYLVDAEQRIVSSTGGEPEDIPSLLDNPNVIVQQIGDTGWSLVCDVDVYGATQSYRFFSVFALVVTLLMFFLIAALIQLFNGSVVRPISRLHREIENVIDNNFRVRIDMPYGAEIGSIAVAINMMVDRQTDLTRSMLTTQQNLYEAQLEISRNELLALENQINPHFLMNTLQCICGIATAHNDAMVVEVTTAMADMFNYSLRSREIVDLSDEVGCLRSYLSIIDIRFDRAFSWRLDIPRELLGCKSAKMVLQPLVENAVYHGLEKKGFGEVTLTARKEADCIVIHISDNGAGISANRLEEVRRMLGDPNLLYQKSIEHKRIGIANTCWRIRQLFGEEYGIQIESEQGKGADVYVRLPLRYEESPS